MKCNQFHPGFEFELPCPFPMIVNIIPQVLPEFYYILLVNKSYCILLLNIVKRKKKHLQLVSVTCKLSLNVKWWV